MKRAAFLLIATILLAGCSATGSLGSAADRLDSSAQHFYDEVYDGRASGHKSEDAAKLAEATRDFNRAVERSRSRDELQPSFDRVAERYHHLRRQVESRDSRYVDSSFAFERVTDAYLDVDRAMNHPDSRRHD